MNKFCGSLTLCCVLALGACTQGTEGPAGLEDDTDTDTGETVDLRDDNCTEVQQVINASCASGCHSGQHALGGLDLRDISAIVGRLSKDVDMALIEPEDLDQSYLMHKLWGTHLEVGGAGQIMPPNEPMPEADVTTLSEWIEDGASCDEPPELEEAAQDPNDLPQEELFVCDGGPSSSPARIRRLDHLEFRRRVGHNRAHETNANPFEPPGTSAYSTYSEELTIDETALDLYFNVLSYAGDKWIGRHSYNRGSWTSRKDSSITCIYSETQPDLSCVEWFVETYLTEGVLDDLPDEGEVLRLTHFALDALDDEYETGGLRDDTLSHITSAAWLHTNALFDREIGSTEPDEWGRHRLTDFEAAGMVSDLVSDLGPGHSGVYLYDNHIKGDDRFTAQEGGHMADVFEAAMDGSIQDPEVIADLVRTHAMGTAEYREDEWIDYGTHSSYNRRQRSQEWMSHKLDRFFLEFFDVGSFRASFHDTPNATSQYDSESGQRFERSLDELRSFEGWNEPDGLMLFTDAIAKVVVSDTDVLAGLLTTRDYYLPATSTSSSLDVSNHLFDVNEPVEGTREGRWTTFPADERAGLLTHPIWLASHGDAFEDGPSAIHRGKWIREKLLCETVPPLELVSAEAQLVASDPALRARDRIEQSIESKSECMVCHQYMNSLGYAFETYNHAGLLRVDDHGYAPSGQTTLVNMPDPALNGDYADAVQLMGALAESQYVKRCFIRQTFRFFAGRDETRADACVLSDMEAAYDESGGSFVSLLETLASHDSSLYRHHSEMFRAAGGNP